MRGSNKDEYHAEGAKNIEKNPRSRGLLQIPLQKGTKQEYFNLQIQKSGKFKVAQSFYMQKEPEQCYFCAHKISGSRLVQKIRLLSEKVKEMKEKKQSIQDQVHLLCANFSYILELVEENITNEAKKRIKEILEEKNKIISKQVDKIRKMEEHNFNIQAKLNNPLPQNQNSSPKKLRSSQIERSVQKTLIKVQKIKQRKKQQENQESTRAQTDGSDRQEKKNNIPHLYQSTDMQVDGDFRLKKKNTYGDEIQTNPNIVNRIKSLDNLKNKINRLKNQLKIQPKR